MPQVLRLFLNLRMLEHTGKQRADVGDGFPPPPSCSSPSRRARATAGFRSATKDLFSPTPKLASAVILGVEEHPSPPSLCLAQQPDELCLLQHRPSFLRRKMEDCHGGCWLSSPSPASSPMRPPPQPNLPASDLVDLAAVSLSQDREDKQRGSKQLVEVLNMTSTREEMTRTALRDHGKSVVCVVIHKKVGRKRKDEALAGTGFIAREAGGANNPALVMTANHVAAFFNPEDEDDKLRIRLPESDQEFEGKIRAQEAYKDLALIAVSGMPDGYPALRFSGETSLPLETDAALVAYYQPEKLAETKNPIVKKPGACPGKIVGPPIKDTEQVNWRERIRHDCSSMSGCSGGPVIVNGCVVGVHAGGDEQTGHAASFVTVKAVVKTWANYQEDDGDLSLEDLFKRL